LTTWHCIFSAELTKNARVPLNYFLAILPTGLCLSILTHGEVGMGWYG